MVPLRLRQFELRSFIAAGGMGAVYRAFDTELEREVAIKVMKDELLNDPKSRAAFYREARASASINHTNTITIYTFDEADGRRYLAMELADQGSLEGRIQLYQRLSELDVLDIGIKVASALQIAQKHGFLHRDIKPSNILFNADNEPKLVDFGLARKAEAEDNPEDGTWGTPEYVAPEKITQQGETFLSDMYSLGGTLYNAITGHVPFEAPTVDEIVHDHVYKPLTPPIHLVPGISQMGSDVIERSLAKNPADRFQSYDEFIMALEAARSFVFISQAQATTEAENSPTAKAKSWWRRTNLF